MSKVDLKSKDWCELVFEGRNKEYGAYDLRAKSGRRHLYALVDILIGIIAIGAVIAIFLAAEDAIRNSFGGDEDAVTELQDLKEEVKKEEKKVEVKKEEEKPQEQKVAVKASVAFTVPEIVDQVDESKKLKSQDDLQNLKGAIAAQDYEGDVGGTVNIDDLRDNQSTGGTTAAPVEEEAKVYNVVEQMPTFPGGEAALLKYISTHIKYPAIAQEQEISGQVVLRFVVKEDGSVGEVKVQKSLEKHCDEEAIRVVKSLPRFIPGKQQGKAVRVWYTLPVRYTIQ